MDLSEFLISDAELEEYGVISAPDDLTGTPAAQVKALFDRLPRKLAERLNGALETLSDETAGAISKETAEESFLPRTAVTQSLGNSGDRVPSELAVVRAISAAGGGDMMQSMYDSDGDGTVDRAANGLCHLTHSFQEGSGRHILTGTVPASGQFTVCFSATKTFAASHSAVALLNGTVSLTLVSPGHTALPGNCFTQGELVTGTVVLSSATAGTLVLSSTPPVHKTGGTTSGSIVIGGYSLNEGSTVVATQTSAQVRNVTLSTAEPSGGINGDLWLQYEG